MIFIKDWDEYFISLAYFIAMKSKDPSTKIGAVIVGLDNEIISTGFNGLPRGVKESSERNTRPEKYYYYTHGECNALFNANRTGCITKGCRMYTQGVPCADCARGIIQAGLTEVIVHGQWSEKMNSKWNESIKRSKLMLREANVRVRVYTGKVVKRIIGWRNGEKIISP